MKLQVQFSLAGSAWELKSWLDLLTFIQNITMLWGFFGNLIFAIIARILWGNHLNFLWIVQGAVYFVWSRIHLYTFSGWTIIWKYIEQILLDYTVWLNEILTDKLNNFGHCGGCSIHGGLQLLVHCTNWTICLVNSLPFSCSCNSCLAIKHEQNSVYYLQ